MPPDSIFLSNSGVLGFRTYRFNQKCNLCYPVELKLWEKQFCVQAIYTYQDLTPSGAIPFNNDDLDYENPAQCFRYKIFFNSTTVGSTPVVYSVTANFSP